MNAPTQAEIDAGFKTAKALIDEQVKRVPLLFRSQAAAFLSDELIRSIVTSTLAAAAAARTPPKP